MQNALSHVYWRWIYSVDEMEWMRRIYGKCPAMFPGIFNRFQCGPNTRTIIESKHHNTEQKLTCVDAESQVTTWNMKDVASNAIVLTTIKNDVKCESENISWLSVFMVNYRALHSKQSTKRLWVEWSSMWTGLRFYMSSKRNWLQKILFNFSSFSMTIELKFARTKRRCFIRLQLLKRSEELP